MTSKRRLDTVLTERGIFESRSRAAAAVLAGEIMLGAERRRAEKPSQLVLENITIDVAERPRFVSRGGIKLANALAAAQIDVSGRNCMDVGASTGGFSDCLLQEGAEHVIAVDVAYGELSWALRNDPRVTVFERTNARALEEVALPYAPEFIVVDVSFISLRTVLPAILAVAAQRYDVLAMVKPQFEVGRGRVGKGGVVRDPDVRREALVNVGETALTLGAGVVAFYSSGLPGPKGNLETFIHLVPGPLASDVETLARVVEP